MSGQLRADVYERTILRPDDPAVVARFIRTQAEAVHDGHHHETYSYGKGGFDGCGIRWCRAARAVLSGPIFAPLENVEPKLTPPTY